MTTRAIETAHLTEQETSSIRRMLESPKYELIPMKNVLEQAAHLPTGATVSVTASPNKGMMATVDLSIELQDRGFEVIPHLSARLTRDRAELQEIIDRLDAAGIRRLFVVGGDVTEPGEFFDGLAILSAMEEIGHGFTDVGITGYPEGHHIVDEETIERATDDKAPYASYITTQMCFTPDAISSWVHSLRGRGIGLGVFIGIPGVAELKKLLTLSVRIGVGASSRFLSHNKSLAGKLVRPGGYAPDELVIGLAPLLADTGANVQGFHIYTFNQVDSTEAWRQEMLEALQ